MKTCGECRMCCKVFPLPVLGKAENQWCRFLSPSGCAVHGHGQPEVCREYACYWLDHQEVPEGHRPDRIGMVATECGTIRIADEVLPVVVVNQAEPEACRAPGAQALIGEMLAGGFVLFVVYGLDVQILYDRRRWASTSEADIEAAFRYERSRDAGELKRLGAVDEDYCPLTEGQIT
ncbi:MAG: hypothetical protein ABSG86_09465 [Thermoguttaceae bacterium]